MDAEVRIDAYSLAEIEEYYDRCWVSRFERGHNPQSHAMHYGFYDESVQTSEEAKIRMNWFLASLFGDLGAGMRFLDAGCGIGGTAIYLAKSCPAARVLGVNLSSRQIELARRNARAAAVDERVEFLLGSYLETRLPDASFDGAYAIESLCHCGDRPLFAGEVFRLLRPGRRFVAIDFFRTAAPLETPQARQAYEDVLRGFRLADYYETPLSRVMADAGFAKCRLTDITPQATPGLIRSEQQARKLLPELEAAGDQPLFVDHLKACIGLRTLTRDGGLIYAGFSAEKSAA